MSVRSGKSVNPKQREFFNKRAESWDDTVMHDGRKVEFIADLLQLKQGDSVLDVGTGTGVMVPYLEARVGSGGSVTCVDYAENMIEMARKKFPEDEHPVLAFMVSDVNEMSMDRQYDAIVCYSCFPHFVDQPATVEHLSKGLRKGGKLMVAHSQSRADINKVHLESGEVVETDYLPTMLELKEMLEQAGLEICGSIDDQSMYVALSRMP